MSEIETVKTDSITWNTGMGRGRKSQWNAMLRSLVAGETKLIPLDGRKAPSLQATLTRLAQKMGIFIRTQTVGGKLAVSLRPNEATEVVVQSPPLSEISHIEWLPKKGARQ